MKDMLENAIIVAANAHRGQTDKGGQPYILHAIRVMLGCEGPEEKTAAMLHDVLEDTPLTAADLTDAGFPPEIVEAVLCLTRKEDEGYDTYIERVCTNRLAARVKLADLTDNMDLGRLPEPSERDFRRLERYVRAKRRIAQVLDACNGKGAAHGRMDKGTV